MRARAPSVRRQVRVRRDGRYPVTGSAATRPASASMKRDATMTSSAISWRSRRLMDAGRPPQTVKPGLGDGLDEDARARGVVGRVGSAARALGEGGDPLHGGHVAVHLRRSPRARRPPAPARSGRTARSGGRSTRSWRPSAWRPGGCPAAAARTVSSRSFASVISSVTSSTPAPGTLRTPRQAASTAPGSSGSSTTSSSIATPASRSSTSSPMTLPCTAPISAATAPRTPGASGSQMRILVSTRSPPALPRSVRIRHAQWTLAMRTATRMVFSALPA